jgi:hypothetical protein
MLCRQKLNDCVGGYKVTGDAFVKAIAQYYDAAHHEGEQGCFYVLFWQYLLIINMISQDFLDNTRIS